MNFKKVLLCYCVGVPICVVARIFQIVFATEYNTGFFARGKETVGWLLLALIGAACVAFGVIAFKAYKTPEKPPKIGLALSITSVFAAVMLVYELICENMPLTMPAWQVTAVKFVTLLCAVYFLALSLQSFTEFKMPLLAHAVPCVYAIIKTIATFINISSLPLISDNILLVAGYCLLMLFFINYGKLYNRVDGESGFRKVLACGLAAANLCISQSLSVVVINVFESKAYLHADLSVMGSLLAIGLFITVFIYDYFYKTEKEEHI